MQVFVNELEIVGFHGVYEEERRDGRRFVFDVEVDMPDPGDDDVLDDTVDYRALSEAILRHAEGPSVQLIETLGERIVADILNEHPRITRVHLRIRKSATGVPGNPRWVGISITRTR